MYIVLAQIFSIIFYDAKILKIIRDSYFEPMSSLSYSILSWYPKTGLAEPLNSKSYLPFRYICLRIQFGNGTIGDNKISILLKLHYSLCTYYIYTNITKGTVNWISLKHFDIILIISIKVQCNNYCAFKLINFSFITKYFQHGDAKSIKSITISWMATSTWCNSQC